jgi:hypothetical protein
MISNEASKYIFNVLHSDTEIEKIVGDKIYPLIAEFGVSELPFISFQRFGTTPSYTKDGLSGENFMVEIICVDDDYDTSNELAIKVRKLLDNHATDEIRFRLNSNSEQWVEEGRFIQSLTYNVNV